MKKTFIVFLVILAFIGASSASALLIKNNCSNKKSLIFSYTLTVDNEGDGDFFNIQNAIDAAEPGSTIMVYSGTFNQVSTIEINVPNLTIIGLDYELGSGGDSGYPIIIGSSIDDVINISVDNTILSGFVITNSGTDFLNFDAGVHIYSENNMISSNYIINNCYGICIINTSNNQIKNNDIESNKMDGVFVYNSSDNEMFENKIIDNGYQGIYLVYCQDNTISDNVIKLNNKHGIHFFDFCTNNLIIDNTISYNEINGIKLTGSENQGNIIIYNSIHSNEWNGIQIQFSNFNHILENNISLNLNDGILIGDLADADGNVITGNYISYNSKEGIRFGSECTDNMIYHNNFIGNNAFDKGSNIWDNGYPSGGNYWSFYSGEDINDDGIIDTPYNIPGGDNQDRYPFVEPILPPLKPNRPVGTVVGEVGKEYTYSTSTTDPNSDKIQYGWDWDGDKNIDEWTDFFDSGETCTVSHSWDEQGTYLIYVKAMDEHGGESEWSEPLVVTIPRNRVFYPIVLKILDNFQDKFQILHLQIVDL